nr:hypothetical protein BaRGS_023091 [Batillaria attramentaria]
MFLGKSQAVLPDTAAQKSTQRPDYPQLDNNFPHVQVSKIDTSRPREEFRRDDYNDDDPHGGGGGMMPGRFVNFYISNDSLGLNTYVATAVVVGSIVLFVTGCVLWQYCKQRLEHSRRSETGNDDDNDIRRGSRHSGSVRRGHTSIEAEELGYACPSPPRSSAGDDGDDCEREKSNSNSKPNDRTSSSREKSANAMYIV